MGPEECFVYAEKPSMVGSQSSVRRSRDESSKDNVASLVSISTLSRSSSPTNRETKRDDLDVSVPVLSKQNLTSASSESYQTSPNQLLRTDSEYRFSNSLGILLICSVDNFYNPLSASGMTEANTNRLEEAKESSETHRIGSLREEWLRNERHFSDPDGNWEAEMAWVREAMTRPLSSEEAARWYRAMGMEFIDPST